MASRGWNGNGRPRPKPRQIYLPSSNPSGAPVYTSNASFNRIPRPRVNAYQAPPQPLPRRQFSAEPQPLVADSVPNTAAAAHKVDDYFSFLEEDGGRGPDTVAPLRPPLPISRSQRSLKAPYGTIHHCFGLLFCLLQVLMAAGLLAFGIWRVVQEAPALRTPLVSANASATLVPEDTGLRCLQLGLALLLSALVGTAAFALRLQGLKTTFLALSPLPSILCLFLLLSAFTEISRIYLVGSGSAEHFALYTTLLGLGALALGILTLCTSSMAAQGVFPLRRRQRQWPMALLLLTTVEAATSAALAALAILALYQAFLDNRTDGAAVFAVKRDVSISCLYAGLFALATSLLALSGVLRRSRALCLSTLINSLAPILLLFEPISHGLSLLLPTLLSHSFVTPPSHFIALLAVSFGALLSLASSAIAAGVATFRK